MKLYISPICNSSRFLMALVKLVNVEIELIQVDLPIEEQKPEIHSIIDPQGKVPLLEDDDFVLFEPLAIAKYILGAKAPDNTLYPTNLLQRAKVDEFLGELSELRSAG